MPTQDIVVARAVVKCTNGLIQTAYTITATVLYSTGHWVGATVAVVFLALVLYRQERS